MIPRHYDCYYYCGYTSTCNLLGGECHKRCSHFLTEDRYYEILSENDVKVSLSHIRAVLGDFVDKDTADLIIHKLKRTL